MAHLVRSGAVLVLIALNLRTLLGVLGAAGTELGAGLPGGGVAAGLTSSVSIALIAAGAPVSHHLVRRLGIDAVVVAALLATAAAQVLAGFGVGIPTAAAAVLGGLAAGVLGTLLPALARTWMPQALGTGVGLMMAATSVGLAVASVLTARDLERYGSWSRATVGLAVLAVVAAWWYFTAQRRRPDIADVDGPEAGSSRREPGRDRAPRWSITLTAFLAVQSFVLFAQIAWLAPTAEASGASPGQAGGLLGLFSALQVLGALGSSHLAQRYGRVGLLAVVVSLLTVVGTAGVLLGVGARGAVPAWGVLAMAVGHGAAFALANLAIAQRSADPRAAARTSATVMLVSQGIAALGPVSIGLLRDLGAGYDAAWAVLVALGILQVALAIGYRRSELVRAGVPAESP